MSRKKLLVAQSGGPTAVINASLHGVIDSVQNDGHFSGVIGCRFGIEGFLEGLVVDLDSLGAEELARLSYTPGSALGSCRYKLADADLPRIASRLDKLSIGHLVMIGGNDTMDTAHRIEAYCRANGVPVSAVGVPKTVDNDLFGTDHTPGYPSAARYIAISVKQAGRLAADMRRVDRFAVFQTVGRDAGWLAAAAALAKDGPDEAPHLIYLPERPVAREKLVRDVESVIRRVGWCYVVVGEGTRLEDGTPLSGAASRDNFANTEYGAMGGSSAAVALHALVSEATGYRGEFQITESLPMCADDRVSVVDREEAFRAGSTAVELLREGESGVMVSIAREAETPYRSTMGTVALESVAAKAKPMPDAFLTKDGWVSEAFLRYLRPLVGTLPAYSVLDAYVHKENV